MKIRVKWDLCDGNGNCTAKAPALFELDTDDTLRVLQDAVSEEQRGAAEAAVHACPKNALSLTD